MKSTKLIIFVFLFFGFLCSMNAQYDGFRCEISSSKSEYSIGETPEVSVKIINNSGQEVYLIGSLDGSEAGMRSPQCYFSITKPKKDPLPAFARCGNMNALRSENFRKVEAGETFYPFQSDKKGFFFSSYQLQRKDHFRLPGKYRITFYYSTLSKDLQDYLGDGKSSEELVSLFAQMPHIELESNTIEIEFEE